jgi:hypothetical protein
MIMETLRSSARSAKIYQAALRDVTEELAIQNCHLILNYVGDKFRQIQTQRSVTLSQL